MRPRWASRPDALDGHELHVHVPAGAIPKDGPSAGVTMVTAIASLLTGRAVKSTIGMTGEVTLQGRVLPIGGLKQKVLAAHAAGLTEVIVPERNAADLDDVPREVREHMTFHIVGTVDEVLERALEPTALAVTLGCGATRNQMLATTGSQRQAMTREAGDPLRRIGHALNGPERQAPSTGGGDQPAVSSRTAALVHPKPISFELYPNRRPCARSDERRRTSDLSTIVPWASKSSTTSDTTFAARRSASC